MSDTAQPGLETFPLAEAPFEGERRSRLGPALAGAVAIAASAGLAWWFVQGPGPQAPAPAPSAPAAAAAKPAPPAPLRYAPDEPDPAEVLRAHAAAQDAYVQGGPQALVAASTACAKAVPADPARLDYCLAYDTYASEIVSAGEDAAAADWFADSPARGLALARSALPATAVAQDRLAQVAALAQAVLPKPRIVRHRTHRAKAAPARRPAIARAHPKPRPAPAERAPPPVVRRPAAEADLPPIYAPGEPGSDGPDPPY